MYLVPIPSVHGPTTPVWEEEWRAFKIHVLNEAPPSALKKHEQKTRHVTTHVTHSTYSAPSKVWRFSFKAKYANHAYVVGSFRDSRLPRSSRPCLQRQFRGSTFQVQNSRTCARIIRNPLGRWLTPCTHQPMRKITRVFAVADSVHPAGKETVFNYIILACFHARCDREGVNKKMGRSYQQKTEENTFSATRRGRRGYFARQAVGRDKRDPPELSVSRARRVPG